MILINISKHDAIGGALNMDESRKKDVLETLNDVYLDSDTKIKIILHSIMEDLIEKGFSNMNVQVIMHNNYLFQRIENELDKWDISLIKM